MREEDVEIKKIEKENFEKLLKNDSRIRLLYYYSLEGEVPELFYLIKDKNSESASNEYKMIVHPLVDLLDEKKITFLLTPTSKEVDINLVVKGLSLIKSDLKEQGFKTFVLKSFDGESMHEKLPYIARELSFEEKPYMDGYHLYAETCQE